MHLPINGLWVLIAIAGWSRAEDSGVSPCPPGTVLCPSRESAGWTGLPGGCVVTGWICDHNPDGYDCIGGADEQVCPENEWVRVGDGYRYFKLISKQTRGTAVDACDQLSGSQVYGFDDSAEYITEVMTALGRIPSGNIQRFWIDADPLGDQWVYSVDNSTVPRNPPPKKVRPVTNCIMQVIHPNASIIAWQHATCSNQYPVVCQIQFL